MMGGRRRVPPAHSFAKTGGRAVQDPFIIYGNRDAEGPANKLHFSKLSLFEVDNVKVKKNIANFYEYFRAIV